MLMVAIQIIASDVAVSIGGAEGNFELNAFRPILIINHLHSALIVADMSDHFREFMVECTRLDQPWWRENIDRSVMMVTALSPVIGYDRAAPSPTTPSTAISPSGRRPWQKGGRRAVAPPGRGTPSRSGGPALRVCRPPRRAPDRLPVMSYARPGRHAVVCERA